MDWPTGQARDSRLSLRSQQAQLQENDGLRIRHVKVLRQRPGPLENVAVVCPVRESNPIRDAALLRSAGQT